MKNYIFAFILSCFTLGSFGQINEEIEVDKIFSTWDKTDVPGAALGIIKDGKLIYAKGYGSADLEHDIAIEPSSVFYIGSVSKQFVTFCILLLEEQGKLDLDDQIQKYLPDFPEYETALTIRHFIHHTSGVRDYLTLMYLKGRSYLDEVDEREVYELIKSQNELNFPPGDQYLYSNSCYFMLAMIVEEAAGESLKIFAQKNIFDPLEMDNTIFYDDNTELIKNKVFSYEASEEEGKFNNLIMRFDLVGSGGVYSSIEDLYLWDQNFYNNKLGKGGQKIIDKMHEEGLLNNGESSGYAFALNNGTYKGLKTVSHGGSLAGYRAQLMRFPDQEFSIIVLANRGDANPTTKSYQVADIFLEQDFVIEKKIEEKLPTLATNLGIMDFQKIVGHYEIEPGVRLEVRINKDSLQVVQNWNKVSYNIGPAEKNRFEIPSDSSVKFGFGELRNEYAQVLSVFQNGVTTIFKRKNVVDASKVALQDYVAQYYSQEIDMNYKIYLDKDVLKLKVSSFDPYTLELSDRDQFFAEGNLLRFVRKDGLVTGFELDAGRVKNLKFQKK